MPSTARLSRPAACIVVTLVVSTASIASAQMSEGAFITGKAAAAWENWNAAMEALLSHDADAAEAAFGKLLELEPSPLRVALLADYSVKRNINAGGVLLFEQDAESEALGANGARVFELLDAGREQLNEADDGWYFASIGRFEVAAANFEALLAADPDPVALLEFADRVPRRHKILIQLAGDPVLGKSVTRIMKVLRTGEELIKADPVRIKRNIARLGGTPRAFENGVARLKQSGEYAIPFLIEALGDPARKDLVRPIVRTLPQIGKPALNPLVMALRVPDEAVQRFVADALGKIGYWQAVPYLLKLRDDPQATPQVTAAVQAALDALADKGLEIPKDLSVAEAFYRLADAYYQQRDTLMADPRLDTANVWYYKQGVLINVPVPTVIFDEVMAMRCCEEALLADPDHREALALWLAADLRREAQLPEGQSDHTRPEGFPPAVYFAQSAGASYCQMALARALRNNEPAVALGAIEALRNTAGPASLLGEAGGHQPLGQALSFPDRMVRVRAALALGNALPVKPFENQQNLMAVLSEAVMLFGGSRHALVVDPQDESANATAAALRAIGYEVLTSSDLLSGLQQLRENLPGIDVIALASDLKEPTLEQAIAQLDGEFRFAAVPVVVVARPHDVEAVESIVRGRERLAAVVEHPPADELKAAIDAAAKAVGATQITPELGTALALEAVNTLELLALTNNPLFDIRDAEPALLAALATDDADLKAAVAHTLGYLGTARSQKAVADIALNADVEEGMRIVMFAALAEAARRSGNHLPEESIEQLIRIVESEQNMAIRTAASQALGALDLPGNPASVIIRNQYGG